MCMGDRLAGVRNEETVDRLMSACYHLSAFVILSALQPSSHLQCITNKEARIFVGVVRLDSFAVADFPSSRAAASDMGAVSSMDPSRVIVNVIGDTISMRNCDRFPAGEGWRSFRSA